MQKFVILGHPRTGTTMTVDLVASHPQIKAENELFNPKGICRHRDMEPENGSLKKRDADPYGFLDQFYSPENTDGKESVGFNLMLGHRVEALDYIRKNEDIGIIYVFRRNSLAQYSSWKIAKKTGQWGSFNGATNQLQIKFSRREFEEQRGIVESFDYFFKYMFAQRSVLPLEYTEILSPDSSRKICDFLEVDYYPLTNELKKQNTYEILKRFENPKDVKKYLKVIGHSEWSKETSVS